MDDINGGSRGPFAAARQRQPLDDPHADEDGSFLLSTHPNSYLINAENGSHDNGEDEESLEQEKFHVCCESCPDSCCDCCSPRRIGMCLSHTIFCLFSFFVTTSLNIASKLISISPFQIKPISTLPLFDPKPLNYSSLRIGVGNCCFFLRDCHRHCWRGLFTNIGLPLHSKHALPSFPFVSNAPSFSKCSLGTKRAT